MVFIIMMNDDFVVLFIEIFLMLVYFYLVFYEVCVCWNNFKVLIVNDSRSFFFKNIFVDSIEVYFCSVFIYFLGVGCFEMIIFEDDRVFVLLVDFV